ncbi:ABC transporter substrate-binding protein [Bifidobacterium sp.]|jgi:osmoprotectant transport system substrate-binding protein|uniref:ABC transporter substrate-binding protein n=1 Tax=Bifidobacterium sp. TaxID=41200 RepID=UPI0025C41B7A|nr:ABC transporter substrate-binding protein [Bifidobacterium sp.]MCH4208964.1 ABC transporter substrate-binding protein [Bifidobacterium sp.]MCI1224953.1 ABC transporter substrate-binding protein [Bifidobacterium sp.]
MLHQRFRGLRAVLAVAVASAMLVLAACGSGNPLSNPSTGDTASSGAIVIGSQAYYSNEIIAEIYAQALEGKGFSVKRQFSIGQRDAYMPQVESGAISLFPEYTGNLLQYVDSKATESSSEEVYAALKKALPSSLTVLEQASATDQDSYTVTKAFADKYQLSSIADLAKVSEKLTLGGQPELADRPYGPKGLKEAYGVSVDFSATGQTTVEDLVAGTINVADVFTADPNIQTRDLVVLKDPKALILASNVVPLVNKSIAAEVAPAINAVSAKLTPTSLISLNVRSTVKQESPAVIAKAWLADNKLS